MSRALTASDEPGVIRGENFRGTVVSTPEHILEPLLYHVELRDHLKSNERELWNWCASAQAKADYTENLRLIAEQEPAVALRQLQAHEELHAGGAVKTVGADKGYHRKAFVRACREQNIVPHVACKDGVTVPGLDGRTTGKESYRISQKIRKRVEEIFGWIQTVGGL